MLAILVVGAVGRWHAQLSRSRQSEKQSRQLGFETQFKFHRPDIRNYGFTLEQLGDTMMLDALFKKALDEQGSDFPVTSRDVGKARFQKILGMITVEYKQTYQGIPIEGTELGMSIWQKSGSIIGFGGRYYRNVRLTSALPRIPASEALGIADRDCGHPVNAIRSTMAPRLVILPMQTGEHVIYHLAWYIGDSDSAAVPWYYHVDASDGTILKKYSGVEDH